MTEPNDRKATQTEPPKAPPVTQKDELSAEQLDDIAGGTGSGSLVSAPPPPPHI